MHPNQTLSAEELEAKRAEKARVRALINAESKQTAVILRNNLMHQGFRAYIVKVGGWKYEVRAWKLF